MFEAYIEKSVLYPPFISEKPEENLGLVVVIPAYNEVNVLNTLNDFEANEKPSVGVEVILVINTGADPDDQLANQEIAQKVKLWLAEKNRHFWYHVIEVYDLPKKHAGVGLARKIGMDEAVRRFEQINQDGLIICYDADAKTSNNYLTALGDLVEDTTVKSIGIAFEHDVTDAQFDDYHNLGVASYELFLRYYSLSLQFTGFPYYHHTIGSSMGVRASVYAAQGGMNKSKAGEDFYFLQKLFPLGGFKMVTSTRVYPSGRTSNRVPFGTGKAINGWLDEQKNEYETYDFEMFLFIREFLDKAPELYQMNKQQIGEWLLTIHPEIRAFCLQNEMVDGMLEANRQSPNQNRFMTRFYEYMNGFRMLKLVHFLRDQAFPNVPIRQAVTQLLQARGKSVENDDVFELLRVLKNIEYHN